MSDTLAAVALAVAGAAVAFIVTAWIEGPGGLGLDGWPG